MFYEKKKEPVLRFGDVLRGYVSAVPRIREPIIATVSEPHEYIVDIKLPRFCVVVSPCCSIGESTICLTPVIPLRGAFFDNTYFLEDLTRINHKMKPEQAVPRQKWEDFSAGEKQRRLGEGHTYTFLELFVYEGHELFPKYTINRKRGNVETNYYMIDFRNTYKLHCEKITTPKDAPLESKCLQLSIQTRSELRDKIAFYYGRIPKEDEILLG